MKSLKTWQKQASDRLIIQECQTVKAYALAYPVPQTGLVKLFEDSNSPLRCWYDIVELYPFIRTPITLYAILFPRILSFLDRFLFEASVRIQLQSLPPQLNDVRKTRGFHNVHSFRLHPTTLLGWHSLPRIASPSRAKNALYKDAKLIVGNPHSVLLNADEMKHWYGNTRIALMQFLLPSVSPLSYKLSSVVFEKREGEEAFPNIILHFLYVLSGNRSFMCDNLSPIKRFI